MSQFSPLFEAYLAQVDRGDFETWGGPDMPARVDSWLEQRFAWQAIKYLRPEIELRPQVTIATKNGAFRVDFLTKNYRVNLAFECDGAAFHPSRDADDLRDAWLLTAPDVWGIYHLPYRDLVDCPEWCFMAIAQRHYDLFTDRALANLNNLTRQPADPPRDFRVRYRCKAS